MRHLIKKQIIEIRIGKKADQFRVHQTVSDRYWEEIVPMLEKAFDAISTEDLVIEIDRFELNLGTVSEREISSKEWTHEIRKQIEDQVVRLTDPGSARHAVTTRTKRDSAFSQWMYYMEFGYLAWNSPLPGDEWRQQVLEAIALDEHIQQALQRRLAGNVAILQRVIREHSDDFLQQLAGILSASKQTYLSVVIRELLFIHQFNNEAMSSGGSEESTLRNELWWLSLQSAAEKTGQGIPVSDKLIRYFVAEAALILKQYPVMRPRVPLISAAVNKYTREEKTVKRKPVVPDDLYRAIFSGQTTDRVAEDEIPQRSAAGRKAIDEEGIYIVNAGMVLLHPFFKSLFTRVSWVEGRDFRDESCRTRAIYLLHYVVTGRTEAMEYELLLPKLLCGHPLDLPVPESPILMASELAGADGMLEAAIAQWEMLKSSSPAALREGFLQRPGKLLTRNGNRYLLVDKSPIDVLLDYLPWGLSMVRLPWMDEILRVEWR